MFKIIKKMDLVLCGILILLGILSTVWVLSGDAEGSRAVVTVAGRQYGTYSLSEDRVVTVRQKGHTNEITIKGGKVSMSFSDCKNQICVHTGQISKTSQNITCLPNKVMIRIEDGEEDFDAVSN